MRQIKWNDLIEAKKTFLAYRHSKDPQERRVSEIDKDFYYRNLAKYVA